jgi:hypothetical protein
LSQAVSYFVGPTVEVVILAVTVRYCIVPVVEDGTFGEVSEFRFGAGVGLKAGGRRWAPHHVQTDLNGSVDVRDFLAGEGVEAGMTPRFNLPDELLRDHPLPERETKVLRS